MRPPIGVRRSCLSLRGPVRSLSLFYTRHGGSRQVLPEMGSGSGPLPRNGHRVTQYPEMGGRSPRPFAQPKARVRRRHRGMYRAEEVAAKRVEVDFVPQPVCEEVEGARSVVARAVKAPVHRVLHAAADGLKERKGDKRGGCDREL